MTTNDINADNASAIWMDAYTVKKACDMLRDMGIPLALDLEQRLKLSEADMEAAEKFLPF